MCIRMAWLHHLGVLYVLQQDSSYFFRHLDLKPENFLLDAHNTVKGTTVVQIKLVLVTDFGYSRIRCIYTWKITEAFKGHK